MKDREKYIDDQEFFEFINREFNRTAGVATIEELADFAFGGIEEAIQAFKKIQKSSP